MLSVCPISNEIVTGQNLSISFTNGTKPEHKSQKKSKIENPYHFLSVFVETFSAICCTPNSSHVSSAHCDMHRRDMQRQEHLPTPPPLSLKLSHSRCLHRYLHLSDPLPLSFCLFLASAPPLPLLFLSYHILDLTNMF